MGENNENNLQRSKILEELKSFANTSQNGVDSQSLFLRVDLLLKAQDDLIKQKDLEYKKKELESRKKELEYKKKDREYRKKDREYVRVDEKVADKRLEYKHKKQEYETFLYMLEAQCNYCPGFFDDYENQDIMTHLEFKLSSLPSSVARRNFRFSKQQIFELEGLLVLNDKELIKEYDFPRPPLECLCVLLAILTTGRGPTDFCTFFGKEEDVLSEASLTCAEFICDRFGYLLRFGEYDLPYERGVRLLDIGFLKEKGSSRQLGPSEKPEYTNMLSSSILLHGNLAFYLDSMLVSVNDPESKCAAFHTELRTFHPKLQTLHPELQTFQYQCLIDVDNIIYSLMGPFTYPNEQMNRVLESLAISVDNITPDVCVYSHEGGKGSDFIIVPYEREEMAKLEEDRDALGPEDFDHIQKKLRSHDKAMSRIRQETRKHFADVLCHFGTFRASNRKQLDPYLANLLFTSAIFFKNIETVYQRNDISVNEYLGWEKLVD